MPDIKDPIGAFSSLYFGKDDAESDIAPGGLLREGFIPTGAYMAARSGKKSLIIGRKGSGKSAISAALLRQDLKGLKVSLVTPDEISADEIRRFELIGIPAQQAKALLWRYIFAVQVAKFIVQHSKSHGRQVPAVVKKIRKFLQDNGETDEFELHEKFWRIIERLKSSISVEAFGAKVALEIQPPTAGIKASDSLDLIEKYIGDAISALACPDDHDRLILVVDQVEKIWSNDAASDEMAIGLLLASKHVSAIFRPKASCILLMRTDIYEVLQFQDRDKLRGDEMRIDWDTKSLKELALIRARVSTGQELTEEELWKGLFPQEISGEPSDTYLLKHTLMRPRDLIQLCNLCRDTAEKNGHGRVETADAEEALAQYSNWKLQDLNSEYRINYPFLAELFVLFQNTSYYTSREGLKNRLSAIIKGLGARYPEFRNTFNVNDILDILYAIGFLGVARNGAARYSYDDKRLHFTDMRFVIHPAFREALRSTRALDVDIDQMAITFKASPEYGSMPAEVPTLRGNALYRLINEMNRTMERITDETMQADLPTEIQQDLFEALAALQQHLPDEDWVTDDQLLAYSTEVSRLYRKAAQRLIASGESKDGQLVRLLEESARSSSPSNIRGRIYRLG